MDIEKRPQTEREQVPPGQVQDQVKKEFVFVGDTSLKAIEVCFLRALPNVGDSHWEPRFSGFQLGVDLNESARA